MGHSSLQQSLLALYDGVTSNQADGQFHVYAVSTIDQGIALLTGREAGERRSDGTYFEGTVNRAVQDRLLALAEWVKAFKKPEGAPSSDGTGAAVSA